MFLWSTYRILCDEQFYPRIFTKGWHKNGTPQMTKAKLVVLLLTAWIPITRENKNRSTLAISTTTTLSFYVLQRIARVVYVHSPPAQHVVVLCICAIIISLASGISASNPVFHTTIILVLTQRTRGFTRKRFLGSSLNLPK